MIVNSPRATSAAPTLMLWRRVKPVTLPGQVAAHELAADRDRHRHQQPDGDVAGAAPRSTSRPNAKKKIAAAKSRRPRSCCSIWSRTSLPDSRMPASSAPTASESPAASPERAPPMRDRQGAEQELLAVEPRARSRSIAWWAQRPTSRNATTNASAMAAVAAISSAAHRLAGRQRRRDAQEERDRQVLEDQDAQHEVGLVVGQAAQVEERPRDDAAARDVDQPGQQHRLGAGPEQGDAHRQAERRR